jgi:plasmid stability protein
MDSDFDENGDLVIRNVPDEVVSEIERRAAMNRWSVDDELRFIMAKAFSGDSRQSDLA